MVSSGNGKWRPANRTTYVAKHHRTGQLVILLLDILSLPPTAVFVYIRVARIHSAFFDYIFGIVGLAVLGSLDTTSHLDIKRTTDDSRPDI
jgi:hypothetical protein